MYRDQRNSSRRSCRERRDRRWPKRPPPCPHRAGWRCLRCFLLMKQTPRPLHVFKGLFDEYSIVRWGYSSGTLVCTTYLISDAQRRSHTKTQRRGHMTLSRVGWNATSLACGGMAPRLTGGTGELLARADAGVDRSGEDQWTAIQLRTMIRRWTPHPRNEGTTGYQPSPAGPQPF